MAFIRYRKDQFSEKKKKKVLPACVKLIFVVLKNSVNFTHKDKMHALVSNHTYLAQLLKKTIY